MQWFAPVPKPGYTNHRVAQTRPEQPPAQAVVAGIADEGPELRVCSRPDGSIPDADAVLELFRTSGLGAGKYLKDSKNRIQGAYVKLGGRSGGSVNVYTKAGKVVINTKPGYRRYVCSLVASWTEPRG
jgi:hypothetical protein